MRRSKRDTSRQDISILTLDDDPIITSTLQAYFQRAGYQVDAENEPYRAIERVREGHYDILLLDFLMNPICGDQVVAEIRQFNSGIFIILLTGHKDAAPPIKTIRELDIQGYHEKSDRFDQLELLVESCVKSIKQMRIIRHYQAGLSAMVDSLPGIYHLQGQETISDTILRTAASLVNARNGVLQMDTSFCREQESSPDTQVTWKLGQLHSYPKLEDALKKPENYPAVARRTEDGQISVGILSEENRLVGLLSFQTEQEPSQEQMHLLEAFSHQISVAMRNILLHDLVSQKNQELTRTYNSLRDGYMEMIKALRLLVDARDIYTRGHSDRVSEYARRIAQEMGKDEAYCEQVRIAGLFHDIGKVGVPDNVLLKDSRLTDEEFAMIKRHPGDGARILSAISAFREIVPIVRAHHERYDGRGYPDGLAGTDIPEQARIIGVADAFDAMTSNRSYRKALPFDAAIDQLIKGKGSQFDANVVDAFLNIAQECVESVNG